MNLTENIKNAESLFITPLERFFRQRYNEKSLPSHGLDHHRRVWYYAKELMTNAIPGIEPDTDFIRKLLIACFIHDIGMTREPGIRHGNHSRMICEDFLNENKLKLSDYQDLLDTILNHDNKEYKTGTRKNTLLTVLSLADDLDAFGYTGIYRYAEIYLMRGVGFKDLGNKVRSNAKVRFDNFRNICSGLPGLIYKHTKRYLILDEFFNMYEKDYPGYVFGSNNLTGNCGVIELINLSLEAQTPLNNILDLKQNLSGDRIVTDFLKSLEQELQEYS